VRPVSKPSEAHSAVQPHINLSFFADDFDLISMREGVRFVDNIVMTGNGIKDLIGEDYPWPMPGASDEAMNRVILERS